MRSNWISPKRHGCRTDAGWRTRKNFPAKDWRAHSSACSRRVRRRKIRPPRKRTPQAAPPGGLIVPGPRRGSPIASLLLGWSLAAAIGLPLITFIASRYGWRAVHGGIGVLGCLSFLLLLSRLPGGLMGAPVDLKP